MDSPCKGVRSAVVTRVEYCIVTPFFWRPCGARRRNGEIPGVKTPYLFSVMSTIVVVALRPRPYFGWSCVPPGCALAGALEIDR